MIVTAIFATISILLAALLGALFFLLLRPPKCPRCGNRTWVRSPYVGTHWAYCSECSLFRDMSSG